MARLESRVPRDAREARSATERPRRYAVITPAVTTWTWPRVSAVSPPSLITAGVAVSNCVHVFGYHCSLVPPRVAPIERSLETAIAYGGDRNPAGTIRPFSHEGGNQHQPGCSCIGRGLIPHLLGRAAEGGGRQYRPQYLGGTCQVGQGTRAVQLPPGCPGCRRAAAAVYDREQATLGGLRPRHRPTPRNAQGRVCGHHLRRHTHFGQRRNYAALPARIQHPGETGEPCLP